MSKSVLPRTNSPGRGEPRTAPTPRQLEIYAWYFWRTKTYGFQPSIRDVALRFEIGSNNGVLCHFESLESYGYVALHCRKARAVRFLRCPDGSPFRGFREVREGEL